MKIISEIIQRLIMFFIIVLGSFQLSEYSALFMANQGMDPSLARSLSAVVFLFIMIWSPNRLKLERL